MVSIGSPTVLVAPLNWGLGHATRCIPIIDALLAQGAQVVLASDGQALTLLHHHYPTLPTLTLPPYGIRYPKRSMVYNMLGQLPRITRALYLERQKTATIVQQYGIDAIISDNRYGVYHPKVPSVVVTHQLHLQLDAAWMRRPVNGALHRLLRHFDACWVPDVMGSPNYSGALGHPALQGLPTTYVGALSRFAPISAGPKEWDVLAVLSGPEPQRQYLEQALLEQLVELPLRALLVRGRPSSTQRQLVGPQLYQQDFMPQTALQQAFGSSQLVVVRSGYSTVLDLATLGCPQVLFVPTPGQPEQEYLAERLIQYKGYQAQTQDALDLKAAWRQTLPFSLPSVEHSPFVKGTLHSAVQQLLRDLN